MAGWWLCAGWVRVLLFSSGSVLNSNPQPWSSPASSTSSLWLIVVCIYGGEIWSHAVTSGSQRVDTQGVPNEEFQSPFLSIEGWRPRTFKDRILRNRNYYSRALPPMCLPLSTWCHCVWQSSWPCTSYWHPASDLMTRGQILWQCNQQCNKQVKIWLSRFKWPEVLSSAYQFI